MLRKQLIWKYARLAGAREAMQEEIIALEAVLLRLERIKSQIEQVEANMAAVEQTALLFDPAFDASAIRPVKARGRLYPLRHSSYVRAALRVLKDAEVALHAGEIADRVHEFLGLPDRTNWKSIRAGIQGGLQRYVDRGIVEIVDRKPIRYVVGARPA